MLSRRNIRIKVMQVLYAATAADSFQAKDLVKDYHAKIDSSFELLLFNIYLLSKVAEIAKEDFSKRRSKHLPSAIDKAFTPKLFENELLQSFLNDNYITKLIKKAEFVEKAGDDMATVIYKKFTQAHKDEYEAYLLNADTTEDDHRDILLTLYKFCVRESEIFIETMWAHYPSWIDDDSLVIGASKKIIKAMPLEEGFYKNYLPDEEAVNDFGANLTEFLGNNDARLLQTIGPELKNWESDRLALVDMILLKMGTAEFLDCPTIPAKVTMNEYVELAKAYSTDKSKEFINGLLDRIYKVLTNNKLIQKEGRGLIE